MAGHPQKDFELETPNRVVACSAPNDVTLHCHLSPATSAVAMEIRWFRGTDCIYLYENGHVTERRGYEGRVSVDPQGLQRGDVTLRLRGSTHEDMGVYICQVISGEHKADGKIRLWPLNQIYGQIYEINGIPAEDQRRMDKSALSLKLEANTIKKQIETQQEARRMTDVKDKQLEEKEKQITEKETKLSEKMKLFADKEEKEREFEKVLEKKRKEMENIGELLEEKNKLLQERNKQMKERDDELKEKDKLLEQKKAEMDKMTQQLEEKNKLLQAMLAQISQHENKPNPQSAECDRPGRMSKYMTAGKHFIDQHRTALIERMTTVGRVMDRLLEEGVVSTEAYGEINALPTTVNKMRKLMELGNVRHSRRGKDLLYEVLEETEPFLMEELKNL